MKNGLIKRLGVLMLLLALAIGITLSTFFYQEHGPFWGEVGNLCGPPNSYQPCITEVLEAGWPMPYFFDNPAVSVPDQLSLFESDHLNFGFFALDVWFVASILLLIWRLFVKRE